MPLADLLVWQDIKKGNNDQATIQKIGQKQPNYFMNNNMHYDVNQNQNQGMKLILKE